MQRGSLSPRFWLITLALLADVVLAQATVSVAAPYLEMRTGPGRGYPAFHAVGRHERIDVLARRTDWYRVRSASGQLGWMHQNQLAQTIDASGLAFVAAVDEQAEAPPGRWELGAAAGAVDDAPALQLALAWHMTPLFQLQGEFTQVTDQGANRQLLSLNLLHQPIAWRVAPYVGIGMGWLRAETDSLRGNTLNAELGLRTRLTRRCLLRLAYKRYTLLTSGDENNEEIDQWLLGFNVTF